MDREWDKAGGAITGPTGEHRPYLIQQARRMRAVLSDARVESGNRAGRFVVDVDAADLERIVAAVERGA